jgi:hypothetical protein
MWSLEVFQYSSSPWGFLGRSWFLCQGARLTARFCGCIQVIYRTERMCKWNATSNIPKVLDQQYFKICLFSGCKNILQMCNTFMLYVHLDKLLSCWGCMVFARYTSLCFLNKGDGLLALLQCCLPFCLPVNARIEIRTWERHGCYILVTKSNFRLRIRLKLSEILTSLQTLFTSSFLDTAAMKKTYVL